MYRENECETRSIIIQKNSITMLKDSRINLEMTLHFGIFEPGWCGSVIDQRVNSQSSTRSIPPGQFPV